MFGIRKPAFSFLINGKALDVTVRFIRPDRLYNISNLTRERFTEMENKFYKEVLSDVQVRDWWVEHLDLILDDEKFASSSGWTKGNKGKLTRAIKRRMEPCLETFNLKEGSSIRYKSNKKKLTEFANFNSNGSLCVDLFRHIRNAVAHKRAKLISREQVRYYHFCDYSRSGQLTAEILISHTTLEWLYSKYREYAYQTAVYEGKAA